MYNGVHGPCGSPDLTQYYMGVAIHPAAGRIPKAVRLFAPRQSTNQMLSYKAGNDDVLVCFVQRLIRVICLLTRVSLGSGLGIVIHVYYVWNKFMC